MTMRLNLAFYFPHFWITLCIYIVAALSGCGDALRMPCGCPFGTVCIPDKQGPEEYKCGAAPRAAGDVNEAPVGAVSVGSQP